jgi:hypothetical protein
LITLDALVADLQSATRADEAENIRWRLEYDLLPNQVLQARSPELVSLLARGLPEATEAGQIESWELLSQIASGACGPTAAKPDVVLNVQQALESVVPIAVQAVSTRHSHQYDHLVVDMLDAYLDFGTGASISTIWKALSSFAKRGDEELRRVRVIAAN